MTKNKTFRFGVLVAFALLVTGCADESMNAKSMSDLSNTAKDQSETPADHGVKKNESAIAAKGDNKTDLSEVEVDNGIKGDVVKVKVISWRDLPFQTVKHQAYDYSCGSAAVATLMTYTYDKPTSEKEVFEEMFAHGDKNKIRAEGFSMLDMSRYLNAHGLEAHGYQITQHVVEKYKLPVIALVNNNGYNHFVVIKTMNHGEVLVGDPNTGNKIYTRDGFADIWKGIALVVTNEGRKAREAYDNPKEWHYAHVHVDPREGNDLSKEAAQLNPMQWQIAPVTANILPAAMVGIPSTSP